LEGHPDLNARWHDRKIMHNSQINLGFAVDTPTGLVVPVIHDVPSLRLKQLAALSRSLVERALEGRLKAEDMERGTFTVTNLGMYGIDAFTPIINPPETAILGLGAVRREAIVLDDARLAAGQVLTLNLTFDHRVVDGAPAARFLQALGKLIENPAASLVE
jgi:pyruvate dehydrogenase E2 component (dihydrolipoamide acetyltransferase)